MSSTHWNTPGAGDRPGSAAQLRNAASLLHTAGSELLGTGLRGEAWMAPSQGHAMSDGSVPILHASHFGKIRPETLSLRNAAAIVTQGMVTLGPFKTRPA